MTTEERDSFELLKGLADLYRLSGQAQRALVLLLIARHLAPDDIALLSRLAVLFTSTGQTQRALNALDQLIALHGESVGALLLRSRALWADARQDDAWVCFKRYLAARRNVQGELAA